MSKSVSRLKTGPRKDEEQIDGVLILGPQAVTSQVVPNMATYRRQSPPADTYFGDTAGSLTDRLMWAWVYRRLQVQKGTDHGKDMQWEDQNLEKHYRGWYDPDAEELFLVGPKPLEGDVPSNVRRIPRVLDRALRSRFGDSFTYRVF